MKRRRQELGWTQRHLAAAFYGLREHEVEVQHQVQMSRYENGDRWPDEEALDKLAAALQMSRSKLVALDQPECDIVLEIRPAGEISDEEFEAAARIKYPACFVEERPDA